MMPFACQTDRNQMLGKGLLRLPPFYAKSCSSICQRPSDYTTVGGLGLPSIPQYPFGLCITALACFWMDHSDVFIIRAEPRCKRSPLRLVDWEHAHPTLSGKLVSILPVATMLEARPARSIRQSLKRGLAIPYRNWSGIRPRHHLLNVPSTVFIRMHQVALIFSYLFIPSRCVFSEFILYFGADIDSRKRLFMSDG